jgi:FkbM family methyltransferase
MSIQRLVYATKSLTRSPVGHQLNRVAKLAAGLYFDIFLRRYRTEGMMFEIPKQYTDLAMRGKFTADTYELPERVLAKRNLNPRATVLELGGCIGVVSCVINRMLKEPHRHVVVEGNPKIIRTLKRNRDFNRCAFHVVHGVVTEHPRARMLVDGLMDSNQLGGNGVEVPVLSIDYLETQHAMKFDTLVMDIEGGEFELLRENASRLRTINTAIIEFHEDLIGQTNTEQLYQLLSDAGLCKTDELLTTQVWLRV